MHIHGIECDIEKFVYNADCRIAKLIECENQNYAMHGDFTAMGLKELHYLLEDRKHIMHWKDGMGGKDVMSGGISTDKSYFDFGGGMK